MYNAIITRLSHVREHSNADKVKLATCYGNQVVISILSEEGELGIYFQTDGVLSENFAEANNLIRKKDKNGKNIGGMFDENCRVRTQKFRGEISDGFWCPISNLNYLKDKAPKGWDPSNMEEGTEFNELFGESICFKYINKATRLAAEQNKGKKTKTAKTSIMFKEHIDTDHFGKSLHEFNNDDLVIVTLKIHGTSHREGRVLIERSLSWKDRIAKLFGVKVQEQEWVYLSGTRRVVIQESTGPQFHDPTIRDKAHNLFKDNLRKGETVYLEIVGYEGDGKSIMSPVDTTKLDDKQFSKTYSNAGDGKTMNYSYGCNQGECDFYVYRMTTTNEDGQSVDYSWKDIKARCHEMGVKHTPEILSFKINDYRALHNLKDDRDWSDHLSNLMDGLIEGADLIDPTHIREGIVIRIENGLHVKLFKHKSVNFKILEGIIKDAGIIDEEELQSII